MEAAALKGFAMKSELGPAFILGPMGDMVRGPPLGPMEDMVDGPPVISMGLLATRVDETLGTRGGCGCPGMDMCIM